MYWDVTKIVTSLLLKHLLDEGDIESLTSEWLLLVSIKPKLSASASLRE